MTALLGSFGVSDVGLFGSTPLFGESDEESCDGESTPLFGEFDEGKSKGISGGKVVLLGLSGDATMLRVGEPGSGGATPALLAYGTCLKGVQNGVS